MTDDNNEDEDDDDDDVEDDDDDIINKSSGFLITTRAIHQEHTRNAHCINFTQRRCRVRRPNTIMAHFKSIVYAREGEPSRTRDATGSYVRDNRR